LGKKYFVLGGNFILGCALAASSLLGAVDKPYLNQPIDGEILKLRKVKTQSDGAVATRTREDAWNGYLQKTYSKMASLMAKGGKAAVRRR
jgi:hexaprenyl-diphosphate synthase